MSRTKMETPAIRRKYVRKQQHAAIGTKVSAPSINLSRAEQEIVVAQNFQLRIMLTDVLLKKQETLGAFKLNPA